MITTLIQIMKLQLRRTNLYRILSYSIAAALSVVIGYWTLLTIESFSGKLVTVFLLLITWSNCFAKIYTLVYLADYDDTVTLPGSQNL